MSEPPTKNYHGLPVVAPHFYRQSQNYLICRECGMHKDNSIHYRNGGEVCDNPNGPCSCGAWHGTVTGSEIPTGVEPVLKD